MMMMMNSSCSDNTLWWWWWWWLTLRVPTNSSCSDKLWRSRLYVKGAGRRKRPNYSLMSLPSLDPVEFKINVLASCLNMHEMVVITSVCHFKRRRRIEGSLVCTVHDQKKKKKKKSGGASSSLMLLISGICVTLHHDDVVVLSAPYFPTGFPRPWRTFSKSPQCFAGTESMVWMISNFR